MRTAVLTVLVLEPKDFADEASERLAWVAMGQADFVTYRGEVVKNRNGKHTRCLSDMVREEKQKRHFETMEAGRENQRRSA